MSGSPVPKETNSNTMESQRDMDRKRERGCTSKNRTHPTLHTYKNISHQDCVNNEYMWLNCILLFEFTELRDINTQMSLYDALFVCVCVCV